MLFEKGPWYWQNLTIPKQMHAVIPNATLMMMLRDPVTWLHSMLHPMKQPTGPGAVEAIVPSQHSELMAGDAEFRRLLEDDPRGFRMCDHLPVALREWLKYYPRQSIFVRLSEDFKSDPVSILRDLEAKLGLTRHDYNPSYFKRAWHASRQPPISIELRSLIRERCRGGVEAVESMLGIEIHSRWDAALDKIPKELPKIKRFNPKTRKLEWMAPG